MGIKPIRHLIRRKNVKLTEEENPLKDVVIKKDSTIKTFGLDESTKAEDFKKKKK